MGKSSGAETQVTEYALSMHIGLGVEVDAVLEISIGEKRAWSGEATGEGALEINAPDLFGGIKKEGGVKGFAYFLPGGPLQTIPDSLSARFGLTRATCPGFRGLSSLFFVGDQVTDGVWTPVTGSAGSGGGDGVSWSPPGGGSREAPGDLVVLV